MLLHLCFLLTPLLYHKTNTSDTGIVTRLCLIFLSILYQLY
nr:MAG TPA: hypothetical protein [Caudoviricetes sp.]